MPNLGTKMSSLCETLKRIKIGTFLFAISQIMFPDGHSSMSIEEQCGLNCVKGSGPHVPNLGTKMSSLCKTLKRIKIGTFLFAISQIIFPDGHSSMSIEEQCGLNCVKGSGPHVPNLGTKMSSLCETLKRIKIGTFPFAISQIIFPYAHWSMSIEEQCGLNCV